MVNIYFRSMNKGDKPDESWTYWGLFKSKQKEYFVWKKEVSEREAEQYELENDLLN